MKVLLRGDVNSPTGYSSLTRAFIKCIKDSVDLKVENRKRHSINIDVESAFMNELTTMASKPMDKPDVIIHLETPNFYQPVGGSYNIGWTWWETTNLPAGWASTMNSMNEIWTCSQLACDTFKKCGVKVPIFVVQGPVDDTLYNTKAELPILDVNRAPGSTDFINRESRQPTVGMSCTWSHKENISDFLNTMLSGIFQPTECRVVLKTSENPSGQVESVILKQRVGEYRQGLGVQGVPLTLLTQIVPDEYMAFIYNSMDVYCNTSRGSGLNLTCMQAMLAGCLVVAPSWGAASEFITHDKTGFLCRCTIEPVYGMSSSGGIYNGSQLWSRIDCMDFAKQVKKALALLGSKEAAEIVAEARKHIIENHGTKAICQRVMTRLELQQEKPEATVATTTAVTAD